MKDDIERHIAALDSTELEKRKAAVRWLADAIKHGHITREASEEVNNHVHSTYSFSPYSPSSIVFHAWQAELQAVGIVDHESIAGAPEFLEAARIIGIAATVGVEVRCSFADTPFSKRNFNNPDTSGMAYMLIHGIPTRSFAPLDEFLKPIRQARLERSREEVLILNSLLPDSRLSLNFDSDVIPLSQWREGGEITERHILLALAQKFMQNIGKGAVLVSFLQDSMRITLPETLADYLKDETNPHYSYDLLGLLKQQFLYRCYVAPTKECKPVQEVINFAKEIYAIPVYPYLGDVILSAVDKQHSSFEDAYLDELLVYLESIGVQGVAYMPPRNTAQQLKRIQRLCRTHGYMEISGVDINSSRQKFNSPECLQEEFGVLIDATWALVAHERLADIDGRYALFHEENPISRTSLSERITSYANIGRKIALLGPDASKKILSNLLAKVV